MGDNNLGPTCGPNNIDLCSEEKKALIEKYQAMPVGDLDEAIKEKEAAMEKLEQDFKDFVQGLQQTYQDESNEKDERIKEIKEGGLGLMKAVKAAATAGGK